MVIQEMAAKKAAVAAQEATRLLILQRQTAVAMAEAKVAAYEESSQPGSEKSYEGPEVPGKPLSPVDRTSEYVQNLTNVHTREQSLKPEAKEFRPSSTEPLNQSNQPRETSSCRQAKNQASEPPRNKEEVFPPLQPKDYMHEQQCVADITKYLIRKDMISSGFLQFDDCPENYWAWKSSFLNATRGLNLSTAETLDLMIKWLGTESAEHAKRMRRANLFNPAAGLDMAWKRLEETYGSPEVIEGALLRKLEVFPKLGYRDNVRLQELSDLLLEVEYAKKDGYLPGLSYLDTARGTNPIVEKLPSNLQDKWMSVGGKFKEDYGVAFPPFSVFSRFVRQQAKIRSDPSFAFTTSSNQSHRSERSHRPQGKTFVSTHKTAVPSEATDCQNTHKVHAIESPDKYCPIHKKPHPLKKCKGFRSKPIAERMSFLKQNGICFRCCGSTYHIAKDCKTPVECTECGSERHITALHPGPAPAPLETVEPAKDQGREQQETPLSSVMSNCTEVCGQGKSARSCSKICLVTVYPTGHREGAVKMYAVLDEQSNRSLAKSDFFDIFNLKASASPYTLRTCAGTIETTGRRATDFTIESFNKKVQFPLPTLIECDMIPDDKTEIPSPEVARHHSHLRSIAHLIPAVEPNVSILLLLGRDILQVHKVRQQINGPYNAPYAQRLDLGWVVVGEVCLGTGHQPDSISTLRTSVLMNGRPSLLSPCHNSFIVKEKFDSPTQHWDSSIAYVKEEEVSYNTETDNLGVTVFQKTKDDDKQTLSIEDQTFLQIMDREAYQDDNHSWVAPLPFRTPRRALPCNREQAMKRLQSLSKTLQRKPEVKRDFTEFIERMLVNDHAEVAGPLETDKEHWYLPMFGVYHPHKPDQIRVVFDSSAEYGGVSLNDVLLSGPDLNNTLLGVLMRFRKEPIAFTADVQQMFYCFLVREDHRDFLRFLWYKDNDTHKEIVEYRMKVHVFGNSPSPSVAIYCMRKAALKNAECYGQEAKHFVLRHFYVDDGLASASTPEDAISTLSKAKQMLAESNLCLHKIASNSQKVMEAFPVADRAKDLKDLCLGTDTLPLQKSLGLSWDLEADSFVFQVSSEEKPFTRRGILSTVNSLYDPLGFVSPVTIGGKALVRELSSGKNDWDALLPQEKLCKWVKWKESLQALERLKIDRCYVPVSLSTACSKELCIFSDASTSAIGAVAYLRVIDAENVCHVGFVMGKSKLSPKPAHTIPRLELCAAVLAVEMFELISSELDIDFDAVKFFTDSKTVLGYICNTTRRFYLYVSNRVNRIRQSTQTDQWFYVPTEHNPADYATRPTQVASLQNSIWFSGPSFLYQSHCENMNTTNVYPLIEPEADPEIRSEVTSFSTKASQATLHSHCFERFSSWNVLAKTLARLIHVSKSFQRETNRNQVRGWKSFHEQVELEELSQAKSVIISSVQAIMNARPLVPVSSDPDTPTVLTPAMLLTQKTNSLSAPSKDLNTTQVHVKQWKQVQCLADTFWKRWKREYLSTLQRRRKWTEDCLNIKVGDVVLLKNDQEGRNEWPVGLVVNTLPSRDGKVRKVEVRITKNGTARVYLRPITDVIILVSD